jgi:regulator of protease activity HflC (stomatin/prohibitin superfamily)
MLAVEERKKSPASKSPKPAPQMASTSAPVVADLNSSSLDAALEQENNAKKQVEEPVKDDQAHALEVFRSTDNVKFVKGDFSSFDDIKANEWILAPSPCGSIEEWMKANADVPWVRAPNATTDDELLTSVNGNAHVYGGERPLTILGSGLLFGLTTGGAYLYSSIRNIRPGQIHFSDNGGVPEIRLKQGIHYLASPRHTWGPIRSLNENFIQQGNISIVRVLPGQLGLATHNGSPVVLLPGRHAYNSALFTFHEQSTAKMTDPIIQLNTIAIIRVLPNELGLARKNGNPLLLLPGLHVFNDASFEYRGKVGTRQFADSSRPAAPSLASPESKYSASSDSDSVPPPPSLLSSHKDTVGNNENHHTIDCYEHDTISIISINKSQIGCAMQGREAVLLSPGIHIKNDRSFKFERAVDANTQHIEFNTIHIIQVKAGQLGLAWNNNEPLLLPTGIYRISSPTFQFVGFKNMNDKVITHGPITHVRVNQGELGYAWHRGRAIELEPGLYDYNDPQFIFSHTELASKSVIQFGHVTHIIVKAGEARAVWDDGKLKILMAGRHNFESATLKVSEFSIPLQDVVLPLNQIQVTTQDRMPMHVTGQVTYRVRDPEQLIKGIGQTELKSSIEKSAHTTLRYQISLADLSMISPDHHMQKKKKEGGVREQKVMAHEPDAEDDKPAGPVQLFGDAPHMEGDNYRGTLCTKVQEKLASVTQAWGIEIVEFALSDIGFQDKKVEESLANATAQTRQAEAQYELQRATNVTALARAQAEAEQKIIKQKNEAQAREIDTTSKTNALISQAKAESEALFIRAKKDAEGKVEAQKVAADAAEYQALAEMKASKARAEGMVAIAEAQLVSLKDPNYLKLELMKLEVERARYMSKVATPAVVFNSGSGSGGSEANNSNFMSQAALSFAMQQKQRV